MAKQRMKRTFDATARVFTFDIDDGKAVVTFDLSKFTPAQIDFYVGRGINQLDGDAVSGDTGDSNTAKHIADILTARRDVIYSGVIPSGRGPSFPRGGLSADDYGDMLAGIAALNFDEDVTKAGIAVQKALAKLVKNDNKTDDDKTATRKAQRDKVAKYTAHSTVKTIMTERAATRAVELAATIKEMAGNAPDDSAPLTL